MSFPSAKGQYELLSTLYRQSGINPSTISYIEAHGTGTKAGDPQEVNTIAKIFCKDREVPLMIGSVKSNIGHTEGTAGNITKHLYTTVSNSYTFSNFIVFLRSTWLHNVHFYLQEIAING